MKKANRRRWIGILLCCVLILSLLPMTAMRAEAEDVVAYAVEGGNIYFDTSTGIITGADRSITSAVIPYSIEGCSVTTIGDGAFYGCSSLSKVELPYGFTSIFPYAFDGCKSLFGINFPITMQAVAPSAFDGSALSGILYAGTKEQFYQKVTVHEPNDQLNYALNYSVFATAYPVEGGNLYFNCGTLTTSDSTVTSAVIPASVDGHTVRTIGEGAFYYNTRLTSVTMPEYLETIGDRAFYLCRSLKDFEFPAYVTSIGDSAFSGCDALESITIPKRVTQISASAFAHCAHIKELTLHDGIKSIGNSAFTYCQYLKEVTIPKGVTSIGSNAFYGVIQLDKITILNPDCEIADSKNTISTLGYHRFVIYGYEGSTAQAYAQKYSYSFSVYQEPPVLDEDLTAEMNITAGAEMAVGYSIMASDVAEFEDFYLVVDKEVADGETVSTVYGPEKATRSDEARKPLTISYHPTTGEILMYSASYEGVNAKEMGDTFTTTLCGIDSSGRLHYNVIESTTMKDYLLGKFNDETATPAQKTMVIDMLSYGAAAQTYFGYNTDELVTADLTQEQLAYATQEEPEAIDNYACTGTGANVSADITVNSKVELSLNCIVPGLADPAGVKCVISDADGVVIEEISTINLHGIMFYAMYDNVSAKQMRETIVATFYDADGNAISKTVKWSVESYVAQTRANAEATAEEIAMVNAMLTYGDAIAAYMNPTER